MEHSGIIRNQSLYTTNILIHDTNIERVQSLSFLGITLSEIIQSNRYPLSFEKYISVRGIKTPI